MNSSWKKKKHLQQDIYLLSHYKHTVFFFNNYFLHRDVKQYKGPKTRPSCAVHLRPSLQHPLKLVSGIPLSKKHHVRIYHGQLSSKKTSKLCLPFSHCPVFWVTVHQNEIEFLLPVMIQIGFLKHRLGRQMVCQIICAFSSLRFQTGLLRILILILILNFLLKIVAGLAYGLWKILKEMGVAESTLPDSWEICMWVKKQQLEPDTEQRTGQNWERSTSSCILSPCLFNLYAEHIMWNARLDESQAGIKTVKRNTNNLRYADDTTLTAESKEEKKSLLMKVKQESEKVGLKLNFFFSFYLF